MTAGAGSNWPGPPPTGPLLSRGTAASTIWSSLYRRSRRLGERRGHVVNVLVLCPHFAPDVAPTGEVMSRIVVELAARDHHLHVVTALPVVPASCARTRLGRSAGSFRAHDVGTHHPRAPVPHRQAEHPGPRAGVRRLHRARHDRGCATRTKPDVVLAMSPPLTLGTAGWTVAQGPTGAVRLQHPGRVPRRRDRAGPSQR